MPRCVRTSEHSIAQMIDRLIGFALPVLFRKHSAAFMRAHAKLTSSCARDCMLRAASTVSPVVAH